MRKVFLITGFNNWGKTTLLTDIFKVKAFRKGVLHPFTNFPFMVLPKSNDDIGKLGYEREYYERLQEIQTATGVPNYIASAFCPTQEKKNYSIDILRNLYAGDKIEMILLEYKWCDHAKLIVKEIEQFYSTERNVTVHCVGSRNRSARLSAVKDIFTANLP